MLPSAVQQTRRDNKALIYGHGKTDIQKVYQQYLPRRCLTVSKILKCSPAELPLLPAFILGTLSSTFMHRSLFTLARPAQKLKPEYAKAAALLKERNASVKLVDIDATADENKDLASKFGVKGHASSPFVRGNPRVTYVTRRKTTHFPGLCKMCSCRA